MKDYKQFMRLYDRYANRMKVFTSVAFMLFSLTLLSVAHANTATLKVTVTGKVTDKKGEPIIGASLLEKGTTNGVVTDIEGKYTISVENNAILEVQYLNYVTQEIQVNNQSVIDVALEEAAIQLNDIVVTGYGTASKRDLTGSITKIDGKEVQDLPNTNPISSLQSKVAGLSVVNSGTPGATPDIRIRGTSSIGSIKVLYVVDGILTDNINYINPSDIESIDVLKDPSSLAIFGVRGAGGVIAITTKKAKAGQVNVNYNFSIGTKQLVDKISWANAAQFKELYEEEKLNIGVDAPFDYNTWNANTDWVNAVTRTGKFNSHNLSVSGATERNKFNLSLGYLSDDGLIKNQNLNKYVLAFSDEFKVGKAFKFGFNLNGIRQKNPYDYAQYALNDARKVIPGVPSSTIHVLARNPYGPDSYEQDLYYSLPNIQIAGVVNPLIQLENEYDKTKDIEYRTVGNVFGEVSFLKDFTLRATLYGDRSNRNKLQYTPLYNAYDASASIKAPFLYSQRTQVSENDDVYNKWQTDLLLNWKRSFGQHNFTALAGFTANYYGHFGTSAIAPQGNVPIPNDPRLWYLTNGFEKSGDVVAKSSQNENATTSGLFRVLYNYNYKYFLTGSFRQDASSQIAPQNRIQNFWALGAGWDLSQENFFPKNIFNKFKLRGSVGVLGNQNAYGFDYPVYPALVTGAGAVFGGSGGAFNVFPAFTQSYLPSPNLKWETVLAKDFGIEANMFNSRLIFEAAYYDKITRDLMTYVPGVSGGLAELKNAGKIQNNGFEFTASYNQPLGKDFSLTISGNITTYKNKVLELATKDFALYAGRNRTVVGLPIAHFYGYIVEGLYQSYADKLNSPANTEFSYGPGDFKYKDINGDGKINTEDRTMIGNPTPDFTYGGAVQLNYKGFNLGIDVGGVYGNEIYREWGGTESPFQRVNYPTFKYGRWHGAGTSNWDPILGQDHRINYESSTYGIEDGSYMRIRNLQIGYNFGNNITSKVFAKNIRIFANVQNLKTFKRNLGYSPEAGANFDDPNVRPALEFGIDRANNALPRVITFGANISF